MVLVTLRRLNEEISARRFATTLTILIVTLFLCWPEAVATSTLFGGVAIAIAWWTAPHRRRRLQALILPGFIAYLASTIILSPYLYYFFAFGQPAFPVKFTAIYSVPPWNFLVPTITNLLGTVTFARRLSSGSHIYETGAYMALPLLLITVSFARSHWQNWTTRLLVTLLSAVCIASLGPMLHFTRTLAVPMPWLPFSHLPLADKMLPQRFSLYAFLVLSIFQALWLSDNSVPKASRVFGACAVVLFTLPNLNASYWATNNDMPPFFKAGLYTHYLKPNDNVLFLPFGIDGNSELWQATTGLYFRMAGGYLGPPFIQAEYQRYYPIVYDFYNPCEFPLSGEMLKVFLAQHQVNAIIVAGQGTQVWRMSHKLGPSFPELGNLDVQERKIFSLQLASLGVTPLQVGGVSLYRVPLEELSAYKHSSLRDLETRIATAQLDTLIVAAAKYLSAGNRPSDLNPGAVQRLGLLPPYWVSGTGQADLSGPVQNSLVLMTLRNGDTLLGVIASQEVLQALDVRYRPYAKALEISPLAPSMLSTGDTRWILLLEYDRPQIALAAAKIAP